MKKKGRKIINLLHLLNGYFTDSKLIKPNQDILVALSAGQDSISILCIYFILKNQWNLKIKICYCNHLLQKETFYTFLHLSKIFFTFNLHLSYSITVTFVNSEQKARNWRLKVYKRILNFLKIKVLTTGHTKSDQIETFLFNLIRGTGLEGASSLNSKIILNYETKNNFTLSSINLLSLKKLKKKYFSNKKSIIKLTRDINFLTKKEFFFKEKTLKKKIIIRPLLFQSRFDTQKICDKWKLPIIPDKSNQENVYTRNRIRKQLLPTLRFFFNPQIDSSLCKYNQIVIEEDILIKNLVKLFFEEIITENKKIFCINLKNYYSCSFGIQRKICFIFFEKKLFLKLNYYTINKFIKLLNFKFQNIKKLNQKNKKIILSNWFFFPKIGLLYFYKTTLILFKE